MFVWTTNIDFSIVENFAPDIVLTGCTERFMSYVPADDFNLDEYVRRTIEKFKSENIQAL
jgi:hypothetical protein